MLVPGSVLSRGGVPAVFPRDGRWLKGTWGHTWLHYRRSDADLLTPLCTRQVDCCNINNRFKDLERSLSLHCFALRHLRYSPWEVDRNQGPATDLRFCPLAVRQGNEDCHTATDWDVAWGQECQWLSCAWRRHLNLLEHGRL